MSKYILLVLALVAGKAQADFRFQCQGNSKDVCWQDLKGVNATGGVHQDGSPDPSVSDLINTCGLTKAEMYCHQSFDINKWECDLRTTSCSGLADELVFDSNPEYHCANGASHRVVFGSQKFLDPWTQLTETKIIPLFCVKRNDPPSSGSSAPTVDSPTAAF